MRRLGLAAVGLGAALCITSLCVTNVTAPAAAETPKRGGILTYMIPADAPPSFDGHRETTFATVHAAAPFAFAEGQAPISRGLLDDHEPAPLGPWAG